MQYLQPRRAKCIMDQAKGFHQPVWIHGVTGVGKTSFVKHYFGEKAYEYYSMTTYLPEQIIVPDEDEKEHIIVLDDFFVVQEKELQQKYEKQIMQLCKCKNVWLILISRSSKTQWLLHISIEKAFHHIFEQDLLLTREQQNEYYEKCGITWSSQAETTLWESGKGNPLFIEIASTEFNKGKSLHKSEAIVLEESSNRMWDYLEIHVYDHWSSALQEFLMKMSIVEQFDLDMALAISGDADAGKLLHEAMEVGDFMEENQGQYQLRNAVCLSMRRRLQRKLDAVERKNLYLRAGDCFSRRGDELAALSFYEKAGDFSRISELLVRNARKDPTSGHYYNLKDYYMGLPEETIQKSPELMGGMSLLQSMLMNEEKSEYWYEKLKEYAQKQKGVARKEAMGRLVYLDIALPHRGSVQLVDILKNAVTLIGQRKVILSEFSVTSNMPSQMNGGKDFCEWSKKDKELAKSIGKIIPLALGRFGKALVNLALAESFYEKGEDPFEIEVLATKGRMEAESSGNVEQMFVAVGILTSVAILKNHASYAMDLLNGYRKIAVKSDKMLLQNLDALCCRKNLYLGKDDLVDEWMKCAPDEHKELFGLERYRYLTKIRVYIANGQWKPAEHLIQQLMYYADKNKRTYIMMECLLLQAIIYYRTGNEEWKKTMQRVIESTEEYHFVRLLSMQGGVVYEMLKKEQFVWKDPEFKKQVKAELKSMASFYPNYLQSDEDEGIRLSENAIEILRLQDDGKNINEISEILHISVNTVKYHNSRTYRLLDVKGKIQAIKEAKRRGLL